VSLRNRWFQYNVPRPNARLRLFCFPYAGGGANIYRTWVARAPTSIDVLPIQLPGRFTRLGEAAHTDLNTLVTRLADELAGEFTHSFALFGHSMGALIAFELTRTLVRRGARLPRRLFVSARKAPHVPDPRRILHDLPEAEFLKELTRLQGTPPEVLAHPELRALALPLLRADFQLCETYQYVPSAPLGVPITSFAGVRDEDCPPDQVAAWRELTESDFQPHTCDGDHFFIHQVGDFVSGTVFGAAQRDLDATRVSRASTQSGLLLNGSRSR
jgi:medium-chain acyl-[acyl-carrier-protein] hydrolase